MLPWLLWAVARAEPPVPSCHEVREVVRTGAVRLDDEALYVRSLALGCEAAAAALGTLGTDSARGVLAECPPALRAYGMVHDESDEGLDALLLLADHSEVGFWAKGALRPDHPLADRMSTHERLEPHALECCVGLEEPADLRATLVQAITGDPCAEEWLWLRLAEPVVSPAVPQILANLSLDPEEQEDLRSWADWIRQHQVERRCVDAWGRVEEGVCEPVLWMESLPVIGSPEGRWWFDRHAVFRRSTGEQVAELPVTAPFGAWSPDGELLVATAWDGGALWFVWPGQGRVREVRPLFGSTQSVEVHEDYVETSDATYDAATGRLRNGGRVAFASLASASGESCSTTGGGFVLCTRTGQPDLLLEGKRSPYVAFDLPGDPAPTPQGALSAHGHRAAVVHGNGEVYVYDVRTARLRASVPIEEGWPTLVPATWSAQVRDQGDHGVTSVPKGSRSARAVKGTTLRNGFKTVAFSPDGSVLVTLDDGRARPTSGLRASHWPRSAVQIWDAATGAQWQHVVMPGHYVREAGFEPDGRLGLYTADGTVVRIALSPAQDAVEVQPPSKEDCTPLEVIESGVKHTRLFDHNGLPCD